MRLFHVEVSIAPLNPDVTPELFREAVEYALRAAMRFPPDRRFDWETMRVETVIHEVVKTP